MTKQVMQLAGHFDRNPVCAVVDYATEQGMLCDSYLRRLETYTRMSQKDFCSACANAITSILRQELMARMKEQLGEQGIDPNAVDLITD